MPELPEVETITRELNQKIVNKEISKIEIKNKKSFLGNPKLLLHKKIKNVRRKAKVLIFEIDGVDKNTALEALGLWASKLPVKTMIVERE